MIWSPQQDAALRAVDKWFYQEAKRQQVFRVFGYAGTGKTTLAQHFAEGIDGLVSYAAFTGKAASVMRKNGCHNATTIHSLIYIAEQDDQGVVTFRLNRQSAIAESALIIIDECSMVDDELAKDLLSFGVPVLVLGDPAQLPPVKGSGYFTECKPDVMLTEIHRQARDNPIIYIATMIREKEYPDVGNYGESRIVTKIRAEDAMEADQILVGRNITRVNMNMKLRKLKGIEDIMPIKDEKLICLKNDSTLGIFNGGMFTVNDVIKKKFASNHFIHLNLERDEENTIPVLVKVHKSFFADEVKVPDWRVLKGTNEFDFGYAITTHKSQGSQWANPLIYDESWCFRDDWARWLYTAVTRSQEKFTMVKK
jgi:exodeoxyribonuclease-5